MANAWASVMQLSVLRGRFEIFHNEFKKEQCGRGALHESFSICAYPEGLPSLSFGLVHVWCYLGLSLPLPGCHPPDGKTRVCDAWLMFHIPDPGHIRLTAYKRLVRLPQGSPLMPTGSWSLDFWTQNCEGITKA